MELLAIVNIIIIIPELPPWAPFLRSGDGKKAEQQKHWIKRFHPAKATHQFWHKFVRLDWEWV